MKRLTFCLCLVIPSLLTAASSSITLTSSANPQVYGTAVTLTAVVFPSTATGDVTFYDGTTVLETKSLNGGQAAITTTTLPSGAQSLSAYYAGDSTYASSTSAAISQTMNPVASGGLRTGVDYATGGGQSLAVGDFNGDGKQDVATTGGSEMSVLLGNGDGTFQVPVSYATGPSAYSIAVGDFNGDGVEDLVIANSAGGDVSVFLGVGNGTFQAAVNYPAAGYYAMSVTVADFNGDGKADLAVADYLGQVWVLLGNGDGTFQRAVSFPTVDLSYFVTTGDLNLDGKADLVLANAASANVSVLLGNGDGTFQTAVNYPTGNYSYAVAVGDFNSDGKPDLVVANEDDRDISVLLGNGDGTFQTAVNYPDGANASGMVPGDFNADGKLDVAIANGEAGVSILLGNGDGTFQTALYVEPFPEGGTDSLTTGDFNGDGRTDLALGVSVPSSTTTFIPLLGIPVGHSATSLFSNPNPSAFGESVTLTAIVSPQASTGTVTFYSGSTKLGIWSLNSEGQASILVSTFAVGTAKLTAVYGGDGEHAKSESPVLTQSINKAPTSVTMTSSPDPSTLGEAVTLRAAVSPPTATGTITFSFAPSGTSLGTAVIEQGHAKLAVSNLPLGSQNIRATYGGDENDASSFSRPIDQQVNPPGSGH